MTVFEQLKKQNLLTTDDQDNVKIVPISQWEYKTHPIEDTDKAIWISSDDYLGLKLRLTQFNDTLEFCEPFDNEKFTAFIKSKFMKKE